MLRLSCQIRSTAVRAIAAALALTLGITGALAQLSPIIAVGPPSYQWEDFPSLQSDILHRIAATGQMQPDDLPNLTRLMTLESVAMLADVHADMPFTSMGNRLEGQVRQLWDSTELMSESVGDAPLDSEGLNRVQEKYIDVENAYRQLESTLGELPGISKRASAHLRGLTQLNAATGTVMRAIEADLPAPLMRVTERQPDIEILRTQARFLANEVVGFAAMVKRSKQPEPRWDAVERDLNELLGAIQDLERLVAAPSSIEQIQSKFRAIRRQASRSEARITPLGWPTDLARAWRGLRERMNEINDEIGLPRLISRARAAIASDLPRAESIKKREARIYRGSL
jgi:hypothetical protein